MWRGWGGREDGGTSRGPYLLVQPEASTLGSQFIQKQGNKSLEPLGDQQKPCAGFTLPQVFLWDETLGQTSHSQEGSRSPADVRAAHGLRFTGRRDAQPGCPSFPGHKRPAQNQHTGSPIPEPLRH